MLSNRSTNSKNDGQLLVDPGTAISDTPRTSVENACVIDMGNSGMGVVIPDQVDDSAQQIGGGEVSP